MSVGFSSDENEADLEGLRIRLRNMSDQELQRSGQAAKFIEIRLCVSDS